MSHYQTQNFFDVETITVREFHHRYTDRHDIIGYELVVTTTDGGEIRMTLTPPAAKRNTLPTLLIPKPAPPIPES